MGFVDELKARMGMKKRPKAEDDDEIEPGELSGAGVEIQRGDSRLKKGISFGNLNSSEQERLRKFRRASSK